MKDSPKGAHQTVTLDGQRLSNSLDPDSSSYFLIRRKTTYSIENDSVSISPLFGQSRTATYKRSPRSEEPRGSNKSLSIRGRNSRRASSRVQRCHWQRNIAMSVIGMREHGMTPLDHAIQLIRHGLRKREWSGSGSQRDTGLSRKYKTMPT